MNEPKLCQYIVTHKGYEYICPFQEDYCYGDFAKCPFLQSNPSVEQEGE